jgi:hypothetical protein
MRGLLSPLVGLVFVSTLSLGLFVPAPVFGSAKKIHYSATKPFPYDTTGIVAPQNAPGSVSGPAILAFQGVTNATFAPNLAQINNSPVLNPGQFVLAPGTSTGGVTTTFNGTPFQVEIRTPEFDKTASVPLLANAFPSLDSRLNLKSSTVDSLVLTGRLFGTVSADGTVNVTETVDSIKLGLLDGATKNHISHFAFPIRYGELKLPSSWTIATTHPVTPNVSTVAAPVTASTTLAPPPAAETLINATATPEPSTLAIVAAGVAGLVLARKRIGR